MAGAIPERQPIGDTFTGSVLQIGDSQLLSTNREDAAHIIAAGEFVVRYGVRFLGKLQLSIVPGMLVLDYGEILTGEDAWEFLQNHSNRYPRSEVVGYRSDGTDDMALIRNLDLAVPTEVLVYDSPMATRPIAKPIALISQAVDTISPRLLTYLPHYATLADWQAEITP